LAAGPGRDQRSPAGLQSHVVATEYRPGGDQMDSRSSRVGLHMLVTCRVNVPCSFHLPRSTCRGPTCRLDTRCRFHLRPPRPCGSTYRVDMPQLPPRQAVSVPSAVHVRVGLCRFDVPVLSAPAASTGRVASTCGSKVPCSVHLPLRRAVVSPPAASTRRTALVGTARWGGRSGERRRVGAVSAAEAAGPCRQVIRPAPAGPSRGVERGGGAEHRVRLGSSDAGRADVTKVWLDGPQVCWPSSRSRTCCYVTNGSSEVHAIVDRPSEWTPARDGSPLTCPQGRALPTNDGEGRMTGEH
jgi:hypothetical protein